MVDYSNWKVKKSVYNYDGDDVEKINAREKAHSERVEVAQWCTETQLGMITQDKTYYKVVPIPESSDEELKEEIRATRNRYLLGCDFTQLPDAPFTSEEKALYANYRHYLRDYTKQEEWWKRNPYNFEEWCDSAQPNGE